jgi:hypothetical protein
MHDGGGGVLVKAAAAKSLIARLIVIKNCI